MSERRPILIAAGVAVLVTAAFFLLLLQPKLAQISEVQDEIQTAMDEEQRPRLDLQRLEQVRKDAPETRARLARVSDLLPSTPDLPSFIRLAQTAANQEGVELISIAPSPPGEVEPGIDAVAVSVLIEGGFHRTESFLARLENLPRLVEVTSIAISPLDDPGTGTLSLSTTLSLRMYVVRGDG